MWPRIVNVGLGVWLMSAPAVLGYSEPARTADHIVGPLIASFAVIAIFEATRPLRWVNTALGAWLLVAAWVLGYPTTAAINSSLVGVLVVGCSFIRGAVRERFGGGWSVLWRSASE